MSFFKRNPSSYFQSNNNSAKISSLENRIKSIENEKNNQARRADNEARRANTLENRLRNEQGKSRRLENDIRRKNTEIVQVKNNNSNLKRNVRNESAKASGFKGGLEKLAKAGINDIKRRRKLLEENLSKSTDSLKSSSVVIDNQNELLSRQRELLGVHSDNYHNTKKDHNTIMTSLMKNDRLKDYSIVDYTRKKNITRLMYIVTIILIMTTIALIFLRKFSLL